MITRDKEAAKEDTIYGFLLEKLREIPDETALIYGSETLTYRELDKRANQIAFLIRERNIGRNGIIGLMLHRSLEMMIGLFAIIKAGAAYLPIMPDTPKERLKFILQDSQAGLILTHKDYLICFDDMNLSVECIDLDNQLNYAEVPEVCVPTASDDLMYVIYTSGSTGEPKGVMVEHRSVLNRLLWMQDKYRIGRDDVLLQKTPISFDVSVWELFWWVLGGSRLCLLKQGYEKFPQAIIQTIEEKQVTVIHFVPSMLNAFLNYIKDTPEIKRVSCLKHVFASGEVLTIGQVKKFQDILFFANRTELTNLYGPTEATIDVTYYDLPLDRTIESVSIGKPVYHTQIYILDGEREAEIGESGELCIAGVQVARGYLNNQQMTNAKFTPSPFNAEERIYHTGDIARKNKDGNIEYIGREDSQVKIRGLRIELGEIEVTILKYKGIDQCCVLVMNQISINPRITAFIKPSNEIIVAELKQFLSQRLPDYMIPTSYKILKEMPQTVNGKIDKKKLMICENQL